MAGDSRGARRPRVVILGGGFAGLGAAKKLADTPADVVIVDRNDFHTFQPLLYQIAAGQVEPSAVRHSLADILGTQPNLTVRRATVTSVDPAARLVHFEDASTLSYDYLVYGLGAEVDWSGAPGAAGSAFPLYTLTDAIRLRDHLSQQWASARQDPALVEDGGLNVVVVGGGATGVEAAGTIGELYDRRLSEGAVTVERARVTLVEAKPELFSLFAPGLHAYAQRALCERQVVVRTGECVTAVSPTRVTLRSGEVLNAHTTIWCAGIHGTAVARVLRSDPEQDDRIATDHALRLAGHPEVFVVGDAAAIGSTSALPQLGSVAVQSGRLAGLSISRLIAGEEAALFRYRDSGVMATIGRDGACVQLPNGETMTGARAQLAWLTMHMALLPTNEHRASGPGLTL